MSKHQTPLSNLLNRFQSLKHRIQQHDITRELQLSTWADLILKYQRHNQQAVININDETVLFTNDTLKRTLSIEGKLLILEQLQSSGNAAPVDKKRQQWEIYWHPLEEWAGIIHRWATANGMTNTVCTLFELTSGDTSTGEEFHGLDTAVLLKALRVLEGQQKCELINFDDNEGVKFF